MNTLSERAVIKFRAESEFMDKLSKIAEQKGISVNALIRSSLAAQLQLEGKNDADCKEAAFTPLREAQQTARLLGRKTRVKRHERGNDKIQFRVDSQTKDELRKQAKALDMTCSLYIRAIVLSVATPYFELSNLQATEVRKMGYRVGALGLNLNQIAHALNILKQSEDVGGGDFEGRAREVEQALVGIEEGKKQLAPIIESIGKMMRFKS